MRRHLVYFPGLLGWLLVTFVAEMATVWSSIEMFHEGWWGSVPHRFLYLIPGFVLVLLAAVPVRWPKAGGWFIGSVGISLAIFWQQFFSNNIGIEIAIPFVLGAGLFLFENWRLEKVKRGELKAVATPGWVPSHFLFRRPRLTVSLGLPLITFLGVVVFWSFSLMNRVDDGNLGPSRIVGTNVDLVWAPAGPGWALGALQGNEKAVDLQSGGRGFYNPSWNQLARYGINPVGLDKVLKSKQEDASPNGFIGDATIEELNEHCLCNYLSEDGLTLLPTTQNIWRLPSVPEVAASLPHHKQLANCIWDGGQGPMLCENRPDKESPLWDPSRSPIYLLTNTEADSQRIWFVSYNGQVQQTFKSWGNPRHGYRCVKEFRE